MTCTLWSREQDHVLERILHICSQENYAFVADFEWYITVLVDLVHGSGGKGFLCPRDT